MQSSSLMRRRILTILISTTIFTSCVSEPKFEITPLYLDDTQTQTINGRRLAMRADYFLVESGSFNNHGIQDFIADYFSRTDSLKTKYSYYEMKFYKESSRVNAEELRKFPDNLKWKLLRDETPIANYDFQFGRLMPKLK